MKRSRSVKLVLLGSAAMALSACGEDPDALFRDAAQCTRVFDAASCRTAEQQAVAEHVRTAPRFATREACEAQMGAGNCGPAPTAATPAQNSATPGQQANQQQSGGGSFFLPLMMGYMMARGVGGQPQATPLYRDRENNAYTSAPSAGGFRAPVGRVDAAGGYQPTSRGGFGGTGNTRNVSS